MRNRTSVLVSLASAIATLYALEALISLAPSQLIDKLGTTLRKGPTVIAETDRMRNRNIVAFPYLQPDTFIDSASNGLKLNDTATVIPLSGIPKAMTVLCNESGTTIGYRSDSLGFRNPQGIWDPKRLDAVVIGDSFAHGFCRTESETITGMLRSGGIRAANTGLTGAGPLAELGVIREYVSAVKPRDVYWLFYEGNDLIDLVSERETTLSKYLDPKFSQHLSANAAMIAQTEKRYADSLLNQYKPPSFAARARGFLTLRNLRTATGLYRGVKQPAMRDESREVALLREVLSVANHEVKSWGGRLHLVYLPERRRFDSRTRAVTGENHRPDDVEKAVFSITTDLDIPVLNAAAEFARQDDPTSLWNARRYHYNAKGYRIVAGLISDDLRTR
ncbi:MAG TPA: hypothetical protein VFD22_05450 [Gemmatimonadaceae bacterium]|nr:hypothetical protein [Gemmatimonadaceae bacterium]